jgi:hypothetical protein
LSSSTLNTQKRRRKEERRRKEKKRKEKKRKAKQITEKEKEKILCHEHAVGGPFWAWLRGVDAACNGLRVRELELCHTDVALARVSSSRSSS